MQRFWGKNSNNPDDRSANPIEFTAEFQSKIMSQQVNAIFRSVPVMMLINIIGMVSVLLLSAKNGEIPYLEIWATILVEAAVLSLWAWWQWTQKAFRSDLPHKTVGRIIVVAVIFGSIWGILPALLLANGDSSQWYLIGAATIGIVATTGIALSAIPLAVAGFMTPLVMSFPIYLMQESSATSLTLAFLLLVYVAFSILASLAYSKTLVGHTLSRERLEEQKTVIGLLLKDFEENSSDWLWETDANYCIKNASHRFVTATSLTEEELNGSNIISFARATSEELNLTVSAFVESIKHKLTFRDMTIPVVINGQHFWWSITGKPVYDIDGNFSGFKGVCSDISVQKKAEDRVRFLAHHDALTGLYNRTQFSEQLTQQVSHLERYGTPFSVLYVDLDGFKAINDSKGHPAGDKLLTEVGNRLNRQIRDSDILARIGGDEFAIIVTQSEDANADAQIAQRVIDSISEPFDIDGETVFVGASIGIARAPLNGTQPDQILRNTDLALYRAKESGKGVYQFFEPGMDSHALERRTLESELRDALENHEFILNYQPLVDAKTKKPTGFEALIRWDHPIRGIISPAEFIPLAEKTGLIVTIGKWVISQACKTAKNWPDEYTVAVNLSAQQFNTDDIVKTVRDALEDSGLEPGRLELEVTESLLIEQPDEVVETLQELKALGVVIAMDDFGTGYSSLAYLMKFPFDKMKIDRSFVVAMDTDIAARDILKTIGSLGESLKMEITVEGIETQDQVNFLSSMPCHHLQGYYFARPLMQNDIPGYLLGNIEQIQEALPSEPKKMVA